MRIVKAVILVLLVLYLTVIGFLFFAQESFLFQPSELSLDHRFDFEHRFEELNLTMADGAVLNALHFKKDTSREVILYFHGNAGNLDRWGEIVQYYVGLGFNVLIMDYRKYGKSTGKWSYENFLSDADEFYQYTRSLYPENKIIVYGRSLGTGFASWVGARNKPKMLVLEAPYTSIADMGEYFYPLAPARYLIRYNFRPVEYLKELDCPLYIIHGTRDLIVPYNIGLSLYNRLSDDYPVRMLSVQGGGHNDLMKFESYRQEIEKILFSSL